MVCGHGRAARGPTPIPAEGSITPAAGAATPGHRRPFVVAVRADRASLARCCPGPGPGPARAVPEGCARPQGPLRWSAGPSAALPAAGVELTFP